MGSIFYTVVIYPITQIIELVYSFCDKIFDNPGLGIIGVSLAVSMLTLPLYAVAEYWQQKERDIEKGMQKQVDRIKAVFKGNEQYMILSAYYRESHYHPIMSLRAAFGLLIQIPFFTAAYTCLSNMEALKGHSFWFIKNMGAPDASFMLGTVAVNLLPIAMTVINIIAGAIYTKGLGFRDKAQIYGLALLFVCILYNSPSGLVLYWTLNNVFSLVKNIFYKIKHPVKVLYYLACAGVTALIIFVFAIKMKRAVLVSCVFALVYFAPLFVRACNYAVDNILTEFREHSKRRTAAFLLSAAGLFLLLGLFIPTNLIASSPMEFSGIDSYGSPLFFVRNTMLQALGLCFVWPCLVYFLYHERLQSLMAAGFVILLGCALLDVFVFPGNYGTLSKLLRFIDVSTVDSPAKKVFLNAFDILLICLALFFLFKRNVSGTVSLAVGLVCASLALISAANVHTISKGYSDYQRVNVDGGSDAFEPIFHLSKTGKNVLHIFLDRAQNQYIEPMFEELPELNEQYSGFTLYKNSVSYSGWTLLGAAACFGGYEYTPEAMNARSEEKLVDKQNESLLLLPRVFTEQADSYFATVTDSPWANYSWVPDFTPFEKYPAITACRTDRVYTDRWYKEHKNSIKQNITSDALKRNILWYGMLQMAPLALRPAFYNDGRYWSTNDTNLDYDSYLSGYAFLDYLPELTDFDSEGKNAFISFANLATHESLNLQPPDYVPVAAVTKKGSGVHSGKSDYDAMAGAMKRLGEWFDYLKENGVYDNTRIVIVSDHARGGHNAEYDSSLNEMNAEHFHPLLMFKDFGADGSLQVDTGFMTTADAPFLLLQGLVDSPKNPFTGKIINTAEKQKGALVCTQHLFMPYQNKSDKVFVVEDDSWWRVKDNIFKSENWVREPQLGNK